MKRLIILSGLLFGLFFTGACDRLPAVTEMPENPGRPGQAEEPGQPEDPGTPQAPAIIHFSGGTGTAEDPWQIATKADLDSLSDFCNRGDIAFNGQCYRQTADIDYAGARLETIGFSVARSFNGRYDGGGHTVSNIELFSTFSGGGTALFGYLNADADIRNLTLSGATVKATCGNSGSFVARMTGGSLSGCRADATTQVLQNGIQAYNTGGIVGYARSTARVSSCVFEGTLSGDNSRLGGIAGATGGTAVVENCRFTGTISTTVGNRVGGIVGWVTGGTVRGCESVGGTLAAADTVGGVVGLLGHQVNGSVKNSGSVVACRSENVNVKGNKYVGGIAGRIEGSGISGCRVSGSSTLIDSYAGECGGVVGYVWGTGVADCHFDAGTVKGGGKGRHKFGGIAGTVYGSASAVTSCTVSATLKPDAGILGGVAGDVSGKAVVSNCFVTASASVRSELFNIVGGIAGEVLSGAMVNKCWCCANVHSAGGVEVGGIAGVVDGAGSTLANCVYYSATVSTAGTATTVGGVVGELKSSALCANSCALPAGITNGAAFGAVCGAVASGCTLANCYGTVGGEALSKATLNSQAGVYNATSPVLRAASWVDGTVGGYAVIEGCPIAGGRSDKRKVGLMGDSISTCKGWTPYPLGNGYLVKAGWTDITSVSQLYWYKIIYERMSGAELDVNTSYSGTAVSLTTSKGHPGYSFLQRIGDLEYPDIVLINGGTNDAGYALPIGEYAFDKGEDQLDGYLFAQAYDLLVRRLQARFPGVKIACIITDYLNRRPDYAQVVRDVAAHYDLPCATVDFGDNCAQWTEDDNGDGTPDLVHPNAPGMVQMADQIWAQIGGDLQ